MSDSSISKIYQFLTQRPNWKEEADATGDGVIVKSEFREYITDNWNNIGWNGETSNQEDIINDFWKSIDTTQTGKIRGTDKYDKNALNQSELASMEGRITIYEKVNEFLGNLTKPGIISDSSFKDWQKDVCSDVGALVENYIKNGGTEEGIEAYLAGDEVKACINKVTAEYYAAEYQAREMKSLNSQYGYSYENDATLSSIIKTYLNSITGETSESEIQSTIKKIIDSYMSTAGLKEGSVDALKDYGYTPNVNFPLNELQKAVLKTSIMNSLSSIKNEPSYENYSEIYESAFQDYLNSTLNGACYGDFSEIKNKDHLSIFKTSEVYLNIQKEIEITNTIENLFNNEEFLKLLESTFGSEFKNMILNNSNNSTLNNIKNNLMEKGKNGDFNNSDGVFDVNAAMTWTIQEIKDNIISFYPTNYDEMSIEELNALYDNIIGVVSKYNDTEKTREIAIIYCNSVSAREDAYKNQVIKIFGAEDYTSKIKTLDAETIKNKMNILKNNILTLKNDSEGTTNDEDSPNEDYKDPTEENLKAEQDVKLNGYSLAQILQSGTQTITLSQFTQGLEEAKAKAQETINNILLQLKNEMIKAGYPKTEVESAITTLKNYYNAAITAITDQRYRDGAGYVPITFTYKDANGNSQAEVSNYYQRTDWRIRDFGTVSEKGSGCLNDMSNFDNIGIYLGEATYDDPNNYLININSAVIVNKLIELLEDSESEDSLLIKAATPENIKNESSITLNGNTLKDILSKGTDIIELSPFMDLSKAKTSAISTISNTLLSLKNSLLGAGYSETKINYAITTTLNYYTEAINALTDQQYTSEKGGYKQFSFTYKDANGSSQAEYSHYYQRTEYLQKDFNNSGKGSGCMNDMSTTNNVGIYLAEATYGDPNNFGIYLNLAVMLNKFMSFLG